MRVPTLSLAGLALLGTLVGCSSGAGGTTVKGAIDVSASHCGQGWTHPHAGQQTLTVHNSGDTSAEAYLVETASGEIYGEVEYLAPQTTAGMTVTIGGGAFAMRCVTDNGAGPIMGPTVRVAGAPRTATGVRPVTRSDLYAPTLAYQKYVEQGLGALAAKTSVLRADVDQGDLAAARRDWLPAHLAYERLGAAYGTFGDLDDKIDGLPKHVGSEPLTGFHRVEQGLWGGESAGSLKGPADQLYTDIQSLRTSFPQDQIDPGTLPLRVHEILENTLQFQLTGEADAGSGTELATAEANLEGTEKVLGLLRPLLVTRMKDLTSLDAQITQVGGLLTAQDRAGTWTPLDRLSAADRERIDGAMGALVERLAEIPSVLVARRTDT